MLRAPRRRRRLRARLPATTPCGAARRPQAWTRCAPLACAAPASAKSPKARFCFRGLTLLYSQGYDLWSRVRPPSQANIAPEGDWHGMGAVKRVAFSDVLASPKRGAVKNRTWSTTDAIYVAFMALIHGGCLLAPATFSWSALACFGVMYFITGCIGITFSYHRQLSHRSFALPKPLEYLAAYCGALAVQGDPIEWVSSHRYHHLYCDTPRDPHTPYEGFWWSHMGWLLDNDATLARVDDRSNAADIASQPFYRFLTKTYALHVVASAAVLYALGGLPWLVWGFCVRTAWVYHVTWFVNSAAHVWGTQPYATGDLSRNNWWVGILAFGEGWHNNHHAFEFSARHGLEWWQVDVTWALIRGLQLLGLATKVKLPTAAQKERLAVAPA